MTESATGQSSEIRQNPFEAPQSLEKLPSQKIVGLVPFALWLIVAAVFWVVEPVFDQTYVDFELPLPAPTAFLVNEPVSVLIVIAGVGFSVATNALKRPLLRRAANLISFAILAAFVGVSTYAFLIPLIPCITNLSG